MKPIFSTRGKPFLVSVTGLISILLAHTPLLRPSSNRNARPPWSRGIVQPSLFRNDPNLIDPDNISLMTGGDRPALTTIVNHRPCHPCAHLKTKRFHTHRFHRRRANHRPSPFGVMQNWHCQNHNADGNPNASWVSGSSSPATRTATRGVAPSPTRRFQPPTCPSHSRAPTGWPSISTATNEPSSRAGPSRGKPHQSRRLPEIGAASLHSCRLHRALLRKPPPRASRRVRQRRRRPAARRREPHSLSSTIEPPPPRSRKRPRDRPALLWNRHFPKAEPARQRNRKRVTRKSFLHASTPDAAAKSPPAPSARRLPRQLGSWYYRQHCPWPLRSPRRSNPALIYVMANGMPSLKFGPNHAFP